MKQDSDINYEKGLSFLKGDGVEKDPKTALFYLRKAASEGNNQACFTILSHYVTGAFNQEDIDDLEALKMARYATGTSFAYFTARLFEKILREKKIDKVNDPKVSTVTTEAMFKLYHEAAEAGMWLAQVELAKLYHSGIFKKSDPSLSDHWYSLAAETNEPLALMSYVSFLMAQQDYDKALKYAEIGAELDIRLCKRALMTIYFMKKDAKKIISWGEHLEKENDESGMYWLYAAYVSGSAIKKDIAKGIYYLRKAAEFGNIFAQFDLGVLYVDFHYDDLYGGTLDEYPSDKWHENAYELGVFWLKMAAERGSGDAQYKLSTFLSGDEADFWLNKAIAQGHPEALEELEENVEEEVNEPIGNYYPEEDTKEEPEKNSNIFKFPKTFKGTLKDDDLTKFKNELFNEFFEKIQPFIDASNDASKPPTTKELISGGENHLVEFKETFSLNTNTGKKEDHAIRYSSLKEICGFLNTGDGTLIIGVTDRMEILGIERDGLNKNKDKYARLIMDLIRASMGNVAAGNVYIKFEELEGKVVCIVECKKGASPTYLTFKNNKEDFFYRVGSSTVSPPPSELLRILNERF